MIYPLKPAMFTFLILLLFANFSQAEQVLSDSQKQNFHQAFQDLYQNQSLVGVQGAVYAGERIVTSINLGYADLEHQVAVMDETRFEIASTTKAFTGLALLMLEASGKIDLDAKIQTTVPSFPIKPKGSITPRQLAGALAGIRHYKAGEKTPDFHAKHYEDVIEALVLFQDDDLVATPGAKTSYSSYGYNLLAAAIQGASGVSFQSYLQRSIFTPLGLKDTGFIDVTRPLKNRSRNYSFISPYSREQLAQLSVVPTMEHSYNMGGGNMYSSARDLVRFGGQFLKPGFISEKLLTQIYQPHLDDTGKPGYFSDGWLMTGLVQSPKYLMSGGSYPGTISMLLVYPEQGIAISYLSNTWGKQGGLSFGPDSAMASFSKAIDDIVQSMPKAEQR